ncbi:unnamed protein product [Moneuplotes crassus]|uniref:Tubulin-tyrosine ligase family protein n=2 Tax=Euplotes crassus TaxID=5936 RepID=A0AAD1XNU0_EUPCR|nr:unnamed protein product [Moneuplotes crassus]
MSINGIMINTEESIDEAQTNLNNKNIFENFPPDFPMGYVFGETEEQEELILSRIEYANNKYLKFKQKMSYFKDRQSKLKLKNYGDNRYNKMPSELNRKSSTKFSIGEQNHQTGFPLISIEDSSPYKKAMLKEEERRRAFQLKKKECMTQRDLAEIKNNHIYKMGKITRPFNKINFRWRRDSRENSMVKTQKNFLAVQGRKKNIQIDTPFIGNKKIYERQDHSLETYKGEREAPMKTLHIGKELRTRDILNHKGKKLAKSKPKPRNHQCNTFENYSNKNQNNAERLKLQGKFQRQNTENPHSRKGSGIDKNTPADKDATTRNQEKSNLQMEASKIIRKSQGIRISGVLVNHHDELAKEQEKKLALRRKATEIYNNLSSNYKINAQKQSLKFIIMKGNNSNVIERCMKLRPGWEQTVQFDTMFNFKWQQTSHGIRFDQLSINGKKQLVNHLENHAQITTKDCLFKNLCEHLDKTVFEYVPMTFCIESQLDSYDSDLQRFKSLQQLVYRYSKQEIEKEEFVDQFSHKYYPIIASKKNRRTKTIEKLNLPDTHFSGHNMWILKVTKLNRGRGIYVIQATESCDEIVDLIEEIKKGIIIHQNDYQGANDLSKENTKDTTFSNLSSVPNKIQSSTFVIQKYIERPLLINKRKFDIRVWVLLTADLKLHFFKEGYLRTSCEDFSLESNDISKTYVHLTNNAVQKFSENYGQFEDGNQLSFQDFQEYIDEHFPDSEINVQDNLVSRMKRCIITSFKAAEDHLFQENKRSQFELFGYDFIIDENFECWLIEINTNPCLEESSKLLEYLIPRMIDDALKLTLDPLFKKKLKARMNELDKSEGENGLSESVFPVKGYSNIENLWEEIL